MAHHDQTQNSASQSRYIFGGAGNFLRWSNSAMLRGGRVTKFKGVAASYSPELGLVTFAAERGAAAGGGSTDLTRGMVRRLLQWSAAPVALLAAQSPAFAQAQDECVEVTPGQILCQDNGGPATTEQDLSPATNGDDVIVTIEDGFEVDVPNSGGDGISIENAGAVTIQQSSGSSTITGDDYGIDVYLADDDISITTGGDVTGRDSTGIFASTSEDANPDATITIDTTAGTVSGGFNGIQVGQNAMGDVEIVAGDVNGGQYSSLLGANGSAIDVRSDSSGSTTIDSTAGSLLGAANGIYVRNYQGGNVSITTSDVTGQYYSGMRINSDGGNIDIDTSGGLVQGGTDGIRVSQAGDGDVTITTADVEGQDSNGIEVDRDLGVGNVAIDSTLGNVTGSENGIEVRHNGIGSITITTTDVEGERGFGIYATNEATGTDIIIDSSAGSVVSSVDSYSAAIRVRNDGTGVTRITTADVTSGDASGEGGDAIYVRNGANTTGVEIDTTAGTVSGDVYGINVRHYGTGDTTVSAADVTASGLDGIFITTGDNSGDVTIDSTAGTVSGNDFGINVRSEGVGANITVTTADVNADRLDGINVNDDGEGTFGADVTIDTAAGSVTGFDEGIVARNAGAGDLSITTADVSGNEGYGIRAINSSADGGDMIIDSSAGAVSGFNDGIRARSYGSGITRITTGDVSSQNNSGIDLDAGPAAGDVFIDTAAGSVSAFQYGIEVEHRGTGNIDIATANVTTDVSAGVRVLGAGGNISVDTVAGSVNAEQGGIVAFNSGTTGDIAITTADVSSGSFDTAAISVSQGGGNVSVDTTAGTVNGASAGINVRNEGTGDTVITTAAATSSRGDGVYGYNDVSAGNLTIDTSNGGVFGQQDGINARNNGTGDTSITAANVTSGSAFGIDARNAENAGALTIDSSAGAVNGATFGVFASNEGSGVTTITTADVNGESQDGIDASVRGTAGDLVIDTTAGLVTGRTTGISTSNSGTGDVSITTGDVLAQDFTAIYASNGVGTVSVDTSAGVITGGADGVVVRQRGTGDANVTSADVVGTSRYGIFVDLDSDANNLTIDSTAGDVTGQTNGIRTTNAGYGDTVINTGNVTSTSGSAINASNEGYSNDLTINSSSGTVEGSSTGIFASNSSYGSLSITTADVIGAGADGIRGSNQVGTVDVIIDSTAGSVSGSGFGSVGVRASNLGSGITSIMTADVFGSDTGISANIGSTAGDLIIDTSAGEVDGGFVGIVTTNGGTGRQTITTGDVSTFSGNAIYATNIAATATDITLDTSAGEVQGAGSGIVVVNAGTGYTRITTADVTGASNLGNGIEAINDPTAGDLTIDSSAGAVMGGNRGVFVRNFGSGAVSITTAAVTGQADNGVDIYNGIDGDALLLDTSAGPVEGAQNGIFVRNYGDGQNATITTADVTGDSADGIDVVNADTTGDLTIDSSAGSVNGSANGINARNYGTGSTSVVTANVTGTTGDGVYMVTGADSTTLDIDTSAGAVTGGNRGIYANHQGSGDLTITVGNVRGESAEGILASTSDSEADIVVRGGAGVDSNVIGATDGIRLITTGVSVLDADFTDEGIIVTNAIGPSITVSDLDSVTGQNGDALNLTTAGGDITVSNIGTITGLGGNGIFASTFGGDIIIENVGFDGGITATGGVGIAAYANFGGTVRIGTSGPVTGDAYGVNATGTNGSGVFIDTTAYEVSAAIGIRAVNSAPGAAGLSITTANVTGTGGEGIHAVTEGGDVVVDTTAGTVTGLTDGIATSNTGTGSTTIETADVNATVGDGINGFNDDDASNLVINSVAGDVTGGDDGIDALNEGGGQLVITTGDVTALGGDAVEARNLGTELVIDTTAGALVGESNGVIAVNNGTGTTSVVTGDVTSRNSSGLFSLGSGTDILVDTSAGDVSGGTSGIVVLNRGAGSTRVVTGDVAALEAEPGITQGVGISVTSDPSAEDVIIDSSGGTINATGSGVRVVQYGAGDVEIVVADVSAAAFNGIAAYDGFEGAEGEGSIRIDSSSGTVVGGRNGILALNSGEGELAIVTASVSGGSEAGIDAASQGSALRIDSSAGDVTGATYGITAENTGTGALTITAANVTGTNAAGILATSTGADIGIDSNAGAVTGATIGVQAQQTGAGDISLLVNEVSGAVGIDTNAVGGATVITLGSTAVVTGTSGFGIDARSTGGDVTIQGSSGTVTGATDGIYVRPVTADITVGTIDLVEGLGADGLDLLTQGGAITVSNIDAIIGNGGNGITAVASGGTGGAIDLQSAGTISGAQSGIAASTDGTGTIAIDVGGQTSGAANGIAFATAGGTVTITNSGDLSGGDFAVFASGAATGPITLTNSGAITSAIQFADADDQFINSGFFAAAGTSDFGEGSDTLVNSGTLNIAGNVQFDRLERLQNSGTLSLVNGQTGGVFTTPGDFVGDGGRVELDVNFSEGAGDLLTIGGAATGSTELVLNLVDFSFSFGDNVVIADAGEGTQADAFSVVEASGSASPFLSFDLQFDEIESDFVVGVDLEERVFEATKIAEAAQALWYRSADAWADHRANARFADDEISPVWVVAYGVSSQRDEIFRDPTGLSLEDADLSYSQDFFGVQTGVDFDAATGLVLGITGGYSSSSFRQDAGGSTVLFDALNIGVGASYASGGFYAEALAKFDSITGDFSDPVRRDFAADIDANAFGVRIETGYRFGSDALYAEPRISLDLQRTDLDDLAFPGQAFEFDNVDGFRGTAGLRLGGYRQSSGNTTIGYYLDASAVREFEGDANVAFRAFADVVEFQNNAIGTYANVQAGITLEGDGPLSGFFQAESDISDDYSSFGGKVGLKVRF
ncbi:hypothetical protein [Erythrobacter rubeus]|uniref:Autotransporter domain-containing protein n=1 Tax=Erythrobacter rubeus TaxID=2760803 RepID=A0ABR8KQZ5_9SPHN|nr:hypothetical protein [Erythrobacter rubeus]MBD2840859.1 hypothetical protein [Erythrobacter rubeus]